LAKLDAGISKPSRVRLAGASEAIAATWASGDAQAIIGGYADYSEVLHEFSVDHDLGIFDAGHSELWHAARELDLIYKPCGAGGGDVGVVFGIDDPALEEFVGKLTSDQALLDARLVETGVRIESLVTG
jgi:phosphomevalonate kinase